MKNSEMKNYFKKIAKKLHLEIHCCGDWKKGEKIDGKLTYGLKWGEGKVARLMGFKRRDVIRALDWADTNNREAEKVLQEVYRI